ncbi:topoisomerase DNA-binding C4 zinc finger domain-containing protein [Lonepinella sp. MS14435]|uniref:DNA topoisomerase family protein n=1 Tax=Lonepinella sp. MS14435 TaxID=3003618 RepID=UPI0036DEDFA6
MTGSFFPHRKQPEICPQCGSPLHIRQGKKGLFLGCSAYPDCDYLKPLQAQSEHKILKQLTEICPECDCPLQVKQGSFGIFIGCSGYPDCHFIVQEKQDEPEQSFVCPECGKGELVARRGRQGKTFYACNQFPHCKFTLASQPYQVSCPNCGTNVASLKKSSEMHRTFVCANRRCKHQFDVKNEC